MEKEVTLKQMAVGFLAIVGGLTVWVYFVDWIHPDKYPSNYNPRNAINGIDTVYTDDSIYTINVTIKDVEEKPASEPDNYDRD